MTRLFITILCAVVLSVPTFAQTMAINAFVSDAAGPVDGIKRVFLSLFDGNTKVDGWGEDHKNVVFTNGSATVIAGTATPLTNVVLAGLTDPKISFKIDGVEGVFILKLTSVPYAVRVPALYDNSQSLSLSGLDVTTPPYFLKAEFGDSSLSLVVVDVEAENFTATDTLTAQNLEVTNAPYFLKTEFSNNSLDMALNTLSVTTPEYFTKTELADPILVEGEIDFSWIKNVPIGGAGGGDLNEIDVRNIVIEMVANNVETGLDVSGSGVGVNQVLNFDVNDPNVGLTGVVIGTAGMTDLGDVVVTTTFAGGATVLPIANGGTNANTVDAARANLLAQAQDSDLDDIAALTPANGAFLVGDGTNWIDLTTGQTKSLLQLSNIADNPDGGTIVQGNLRVEGNITLTGNQIVFPDGPFSFSDRRLKKNIVKIADPLSRLQQLSGYTYEFRNDEFPDKYLPKGKKYGLIAQEVEAVFPELVITQKDGDKLLNYVHLNAVFLEAIKAQQLQIEALKIEVEALKNR